MKKRLIVMVSLIIILLVAIGAVSAQNINATDNGSSNTLGANVNGNNSVDDSTNGGSLGSSNQLTSSGIYVNGSVSTSGDGSKDSPFRTLIEAYTAAVNGDTIYVASGTYTGRGVNVDFLIKKEITLTSYGDGPAILDGEKSNHIFEVNANNVEISGITVINGITGHNIGGAISWYSDNGKIYNCSFVNCDVGGIVNGAAISWRGSHGNVSHCSFINNSAAYGGAIYWFGNHGSVSECVFVNNGALNGSAIWWGDYSPFGYGTNGSVSGCVFIGNDVWLDGVIYLNNPDTATTNNFKVNNNIFLNNTGHEIYFVNPDDTSNVDYNWFGNTYDDRIVAPNTYQANITNWLYLNTDGDFHSLNPGDSLTVNYDLYNYDNSTGEGSIYNASDVPTITFNVSSKYGLANASSIDLVEGHTSVLYTSLCNQNDLTISCSTFNFGLSYSKFYVNGTVSVSGNGSKDSPFKTLVEAYNAAGNGDTIYVASGTYTGGGVNVGLSIYNEITLTAYGDGPVIFDGEKSNHIFEVNANNVEISGITVINSVTSSGLGGAIAWFGHNGKIYNCSFINCIIGGKMEGGAIYWKGSHGNVSNCSFINNLAYDGGAIYWLGGDGYVSHCVFVNNSAYGGGGAIWWGSEKYLSEYGTNGSVSGCVFIGNDVWVDGVIYLNNPDTATTNNFKVNNNIFLNNTGHEIYFVNPDDTSNVDYNWFGNNATDYEKKPELCNVEASVWLFLNATANPNPVAIFSSSDITFKLSAYNNTSNNITHNYDNSLLIPVNLTVNITSGKVDKSIISLNETARFTPSILGKANVTASIVNAEYTIELNGIKANPNLSVESQPITYGENAVINLYYNPNATGTVNITINGSKFNKTYRNLKLNATFVIPDILPADTYDVCVSYSGDINFINVTVNTSLAVKKAPSALEVNGTAVYCGNDAILKYAAVNATGLNVSIVSHMGKRLAEGIDYNLTLSDSQIVIGGLAADSYFVNVTALTDANHLETSQSVVVEIYPFAALEVEKTVSNTSVYCGDIITYSIAVKNNGPSNATSVRIRDNLSGLVELINATLDHKSIDFPGEYIISSIANGQSKVIVLTVKAVNSGTLENIVYVNGSEEGSRANASSPAVVIEENPITIIAPDVTKYYNGPESFAVTLTDSKSMPISNAHVEITISGITYNRTTDANGQAFLSLELNSGIYSVTTQCNDTEVVSTVTVKSTVIGSDLTKVYRNASQYEATFVDTAGNVLANHTAVVFNINGVFYTRYTNEKGVARLNINLNPGEYIITAKNPNSTEMYTNVVTVLPSIVNNHDLIKYYRNASQYVVTILDDVGKPVAGKIVTFNINGMLYNRTTNATGQAMLNINLNPGEYIITAEYNGLKASNMIKVLPVIETADLHMKYMDGSKFEAKILDGQGMHYPKQEVTFNINGIFYTRPTDDAGIARLNIRLMPGEYIITSSFNGLNAANKITISS